MNVRRFVAATSREALRQVREALGGDAVILANRGTPTGVEILAAASEEVVQLAMSPQAKVAQPQNIATPEVEVAPAVKVAPVVKPEPAQRVITTADLIVEAQTARARKRLVPAAPPEVSVPSSSTSLIPTRTDKHLAEEMRSMRGFIEEQIASLAWTETMRKQPIRMKLFQDMLAAGFSPVLSRHLQRNLPERLFTGAGSRMACRCSGKKSRLQWPQRRFDRSKWRLRPGRSDRRRQDDDYRKTGGALRRQARCRQASTHYY